MVIDMNCSLCRKPFNANDHVYLDEFHSVMHYYCFPNNSKIIGVGTFKEIINKFDFFEQLRPKERNHKQEKA
jgi:hypothetical protein